MHRTTIMLPPDLKLKVLKRARRQGVSLGEFVRESLEERLKKPAGKAVKDPLFDFSLVWRGPAPKDGSINHDHYLYDEEKP